MQTDDPSQGKDSLDDFLEELSIGQRSNKDTDTDHEHPFLWKDLATTLVKQQVNPSHGHRVFIADPSRRKATRQRIYRLLKFHNIKDIYIVRESGLELIIEFDSI
jgi:hypothetical protein